MESKAFYSIINLEYDEERFYNSFKCLTLGKRILFRLTLLAAPASFIIIRTVDKKY